MPTSPRILTIQLSFAYLSTEKRSKVIPNLPFDLLFEHKGTSGHTEMIFVWHDLRLDTHRVDFMPKVHTSYPIWPPCDKGEFSEHTILFCKNRKNYQ